MQAAQTINEQSTDNIYAKISKVYSRDQWDGLSGLVEEINALKREKNAVILAHNYMTPDIFYGVADIVGDSLKLAQEAAKTKADIIVQAGVHFMAETSKILCPDKTILMPDMKAGCSLSEGITAADVRALKEKNPGVPVITYVNTSAEVKAESDLCCTSGNVVQIVKAMQAKGHNRLYLIPDQYLARNVALQVPDVEILTYEGSCIVHERYTADDIARIRKDNPEAVILGHLECTQEVIAACDFAGSTAQMNDYIIKHQPKKAVLITECAMSDNVAASNPGVEFVGGCQLCPYMKRITLPKILDSLKSGQAEITVPADIASRARQSVENMLALSA